MLSFHVLKPYHAFLLHQCLLWRSVKESDSCFAQKEPPLLNLSRFHSEEFGYLRGMISQDGLGRSFHNDTAKERLPSVAQADEREK